MSKKLKSLVPNQHMQIFHTEPNDPVYYRVHYTRNDFKGETFVRLTAISADTGTWEGYRVTRHEHPATWAKCREVLLTRFLQAEKGVAAK